MRLNQKNLTRVRAKRPDYDRSLLSPGIVHLGIGAFHRGHQAVYVDDLLGQDPGWGIVGVSLRSASTFDALQPQDGLYTVATDGHYRVIGSVMEVLTAAAGLAAVMDRLCDQRTRIVSMTVTEKGYHVNPASGELDVDAPEILADQRNPAAPRSAIGVLVEAIYRRRREGLPAFTVLSCDNLANNGATTRRIVEQFAQLRAPDLANYVAQTVSFPATMVDRIVPATTDADRDRISAAIGLTDHWPIVTEPFTQWVVEDDFRAGRPAFEQAGVQMVADVEPFERMKLRMLNASHSAIAYLGYLAGCETVCDAMANAQVRKFVHRLMTDEIMPTLNMPVGIDLAGYRDALIERFSNPAIRHRTWQIAMDGSQKIPPRVLDTVRERLSAGADYRRLALIVAGWMRYVGGIDERGEAIDVRDPLSTTFAELAAAHGPGSVAIATALCAREDVFGTDLAGNESFVGTVLEAYERLVDVGAQRALCRIN